MCHQPISHQREIVELLDPQPVLDYLLQNGALQQKDVDAIQGEESQAKVNLTLLSRLQGNGRRAQNLLVNALRQTGQLHLANLLDEGIRIKTFSGSGYLSKKRHRGQLTLHIEIKALKFDQDSVYSILKSPRKASLSREWVSVDDIRQRISVIMDSQTKLSSIQQFQIVETDDSPKRSCLCACFASLFSRKKREKSHPPKSASYINGDTNGNNVNRMHPSPSVNSTRRGTSPSRYISHTTHITSTSSPANSTQPSQQDLTHSSPRDSHTSLENLRNLLDMFQRKSEDVQSVLQDSQGKTRTELIKYFEQGRSVLVLDTEAGEGFIMRIICTTQQQVDSIHKDLLSGKLSRDLETRITNDEVMERTGLLGIKVKALIDQDELDLAEQELA